jgi:Trypsin-like peptidase domain
VSVIVNYWIKTTCQVITEEGTGTGFLFGIKEKKKIYFVTNKHVINKAQEKRQQTSEIKLSINSEDKNGLIKKDNIVITFQKNQWREHADPDVDVFVLDVTNAILHLHKKYGEMLYGQSILDSYLADQDKIQQYDIKITDEVFIIGYPSDDKLQHHTTNFPFVTSGMISSKIGEALEDEIKDEQGKSHRRVLRAFLINGGILPGSSGSPVILKPTPYRQIRNEILYDNFPPILLGIASETRFIFTDNFYGRDYYSFANLGLAFDAITIKETIDLFENQ